MRKVAFLLMFALLLALVPVVGAGGWATVTLDETPGEIRAGETWVVGLTVLQHGVTPVHSLGEGVPVEPTFTAANAATGERVEAVARPDTEIGRFTLEVVFPDEGEWTWTIYPAPLAGDETRHTLTVLPPAPAVDARSLATVAAGRASLPVFLVVVGLVVVLGLLPWLSTRGRDRRAEPRPQG